MFKNSVACFTLLLIAAGGVVGAPQTPVIPSPVVHFAVIGDRTGSHQEGVYERIIAQVERLRPDFAVTVGDHIEGYTDDTTTLKSQWDEYFGIVKPLTMPLYLTPGNHDITTDAALPVFRKVVGEPYRSFDIGTMHFIILDNSRWESSDKLSREQIDWLTQDLQSHASAELTFVFFHKPFWYNSTATGKPDLLHSLFVKYGVDAVFSGHFHQYFSGKLDGVQYTAVGSSGASLDADPAEIGYHFAWVTVDHGVVDISPVKIDAVQPWDLMNVTDMHDFDRVTRSGVQVQTAVPVASDLTVPSAAVGIEVHNLLGSADVNDTVRWSVPSGWNVEPATSPISVPKSGQTTLTFQVKGNGPLYPVPKFEVRLPLKNGKPVTIAHELRVARTVTCLRAQARPVIDGKLTEAVWRDPTSSFFSWDNSRASIDSTYCYFAYDDGNLYVAAKCRESKPDSIRATVTQRDGGVSGDDCVGYFLQPDLAKDTVYQVYFNALGVIFDQKISRREGESYYAGDKSWNGDYVVKTARDGTYWTLEASIPLKQFGVKGSKGVHWGLNFRRKQPHMNGAADWQEPIDYNPQTFGVLLFQ
jgi:3',5'-cyclic AMP phosphodiesterase CpdA